jgi:hypothetical protein
VLRRAGARADAPPEAITGESGVTVRFGRQTPTIAAGPIGTLSAPTGVRSIW